MKNKYILEKNWVLIARVARDLKKKDVAQMLDISLNTYKKYEDNPGTMTIDDMIKVSNLFDTDLESVFINKALEYRKEQAWRNSSKI